MVFLQPAFWNADRVLLMWSLCDFDRNFITLLYPTVPLGNLFVIMISDYWFAEGPIIK